MLSRYWVCLQESCTWRNYFPGKFNDFTCPGLVTLCGFHDFRTHSCHLRTLLPTDDSSHNIPAKGRPGLKEQSRLFINGKFGAVGSETGFELGCYPRRKGSSDSGGRKEKYRRTVFLCKLTDHLRIRLILETLERGVINQVYSACAVLQHLLGCMLNVIS